MKIYTKTGDKGETVLGKGKRLQKTDLLVQTLGLIDELNCTIGVVLAHENLEKNTADILLFIQQQLFCLGAELNQTKEQKITDENVKWLEQIIDSLDEKLPALKTFILPGGHIAAAQMHLARAVCRRTEIQLVALNEQESIRPYCLQYLNRLSDLLFMIARSINHTNGVVDIPWHD